MDNSDIKLAFRQLLNNKLYTLVNLVGLGLASAFCVLVYLYTTTAANFDNFHKRGDQLYRVELTGIFAEAQGNKVNGFFDFLSNSDESRNSILLPPSFAIDIKRNFPEIEDFVRFDGLSSPVIRANGQSYQEKNNISYVDQNFFDVFNYPLLKGNPATAIKGRTDVVISESLANKYFGNQDPIGKTLAISTYDTTQYAVVNGVMKDFPVNSSMQFDLVLPISAMPDYQEKLSNGINDLSEPLIIKLKAGVNHELFTRKLNSFARNYFKPLEELLQSATTIKSGLNNIYLRPFKEVHYYGAWGHRTNLKLIYQLAGLALLILFIACFNYILLSLTNTISRSKAAVIRKIVGASRWHLALQNFLTTQVLAVLAVIFGFIIALIFIPYFNRLTGAGISLGEISLINILGMIILLSILLGLIAGLYPSLVMSGLNPVRTLKGATYKINSLFSKTLTVFQFCVCIILIISCFIINKQIRFINNVEMGFDRDNVLILESPFDYMQKEKSDRLKDAISHFADSRPEIIGFTATSSNFDMGPTDGIPISGENRSVDRLNVDYNYFKFNNIPIVLGREFSNAIASDSLSNQKNNEKEGGIQAPVLRRVVVNQTLYKLLGKPALGTYNSDISATIIGVCKDYHNRNLTQAINPTCHTLNDDALNYYWIKIRAGQNIPTVLENIKREFDSITNKMPFKFSFLDDDVAESYQSYVNWMDTVASACIIAMFIACLGLFGLSSILAMNKAKEIGIKKILGATVTKLFFILNKDTLQMALLSFTIAVPISLILCNEWLKSFAYRVKPDIYLVIASGVLTILVALISVSYHTLRLARANPIKSLRDE